MSAPDHAHRAHEGHEHEDRQAAAPVARTLTVGAADDIAEADADRRAARALGWLAGQPATAGAVGESRIHRSPAPAGPSAGGGAVIGHEGGALDQDTHRGIESARGSGRPLTGAVRESMESAFGTDLGRVRIHDTPAADKISRSISAEAFTTGNDVFFSRGAYDPGSARGQHVLAHELGHVMQHRGGSVHRLWNPFKKTPEEQAKADAAAAKKKAIEQARAEMKAKDTAARLEAKRVNADNKRVTAKMKGSHAAAPNKNETPAELKRLQQDFQALLDQERRAREQAAAAGLSEVKQEKAADEVWAGARSEVRAFRPLRFDDFDKALNEVRELMAEGLAEQSGEAAKMLQDNEAASGAPLDPAKALAKVQEQRVRDRRGARMAQSAGKDPAAAAEEDKTDAKAKAAEKLVEAKKANTVGTGADARITAKSERKALQEKYDQNADVNDAQSALGTGGKVVDAVGKGTKQGTGQVTGQGVFGATEGTGSQVSELVGTSAMGLGQVLTLVSDILKFVTTMTDIKSGAADPGAKVTAAREAVGILTTGAGVTRTTLLAARDGVQSFGGMGTVVSDVGSALPIVGLITSVLGIIDGSLALVPVSTRLGSGLQSVEEAVLAGKAPLAASLDRVNSRNAQLVEKNTFDIAKNSTMLGLNIAEIATAGGFAVPMAAKLSVSIIGAVHSLGHKVYDTVGESRSSTAKKAFGVEKKEGASRDVLKYDIGSSVDVLIVGAKKHGLDFAKKALLEYGVTEAEIGSMRLHELRAKVLEGLEAEGDPKTVGEKIDAVKDAVKEAVGVEKKPTGVKDDKSTLDEVLGVPKAIGSALAGLPGKVSAAIDDIKANHEDGRRLVEAKNKLNYNGKSDRGGASARWYADRDAKKNEKSFAKVRQDLIAAGMVDEAKGLRTAADRKSREKVAAAKLVGAAAGTQTAIKINQSFVDRVAAASDPQLYEILAGINQKDPAQLGNLEYLSYEVQRRMTAAGVTA